ncbi:ATP-binding protein [Pseudofrankia sp. BMG5.37]|uniref:ATP-binding protein n=1 Tax=Pseudofrankia sp. BMG5.37 TaxID=3050035 RepID=UPI0037C8F09B
MATAARKDRQTAPGHTRQASSVAPRVAVARFRPTAAVVSEVRGRAVATLRGWRVDPAAVESVELVVGELASNAVKASGPDADFVAVRLSAGNGSVLVEVWDHDDATVPQVVQAGADEETGRGLLLVEAVSARWSWYRARSGGKVVWARVAGSMAPRPCPAGEIVPPLRRRVAVALPLPWFPVTFSTDPAMLGRVADGLRALDDWHRPGAVGVSGVGERVAP